MAILLWRLNRNVIYITSLTLALQLPTQLFILALLPHLLITCVPLALFTAFYSWWMFGNRAHSGVIVVMVVRADADSPPFLVRGNEQFTFSRNGPSSPTNTLVYLKDSKSSRFESHPLLQPISQTLPHSQSLHT